MREPRRAHPPRPLRRSRWVRPHETGDLLELVGATSRKVLSTELVDVAVAHGRDLSEGLGVTVLGITVLHSLNVLGALVGSAETGRSRKPGPEFAEDMVIDSEILDPVDEDSTSGPVDVVAFYPDRLDAADELDDTVDGNNDSGPPETPRETQPRDAQSVRHYRR